MATFKQSDYFPILRSIIRENIVVPFDCFLLLKANQRLVKIVHANEPFEKSQLERLERYNIEQIYVSNPDRTLYDAYLRSFFKTEDGEKILRQAYEDSAGKTVTGISNEIAAEFSQVTSLDELDEHGKVTITDPKQANNLGSIINLLKNSADDFSKTTTSSTQLTYQEKILIKGVIKKIDNQLQKIDGTDDLSNIDSKSIIKETTEKIFSELTRIRPFTQARGHWGNNLAKYVKSVEEKTRTLQKTDKSNQSASEDRIVIKSTTMNIRDEIGNIRNLIYQRPLPIKEEIENTIASLVYGVENVLGRPLELNFSTAKKEEKEKIDKPLLNKVKNIIEKQKQQINDLSKQVKENKPSVTTAQKGLKELVNLSNNMAEAINTEGDSTISIDPNLLKRLHAIIAQQKIVIAEFIQKINALEKKDPAAIAKITQDGINQLIKISHDFSETVGIKREKSDFVHIPNETIEENNKLRSTLDSARQLLTPPEQAKYFLQKHGRNKTSIAEDDPIISENKILKTQVENASALITNNEDKIKELQTLIDENGKYISHLEKECAHYKENYNKQGEKIITLEEQNTGILEESNTSQNMIERVRKDLKRRDETIGENFDRIQFLENEIERYKSNFKGIDTPRSKAGEPPPKIPIAENALVLIKAKDKMIKKLSSNVIIQKQHCAEMSRKYDRAQAQTQNNLNMKKRMSLKFELLRAQKEEMQKNSKTIDRKEKVTANLLHQERNTINKLTSMIEELRADRVKYIAQTNENMHNYREMMSKASRLSGNVQAKEQQNKKLTEQLNILKRKNIELASSNNSGNPQKVKAMEKEIEILKSGRSRITDNVLELKNKVDNLNNELDTYKMIKNKKKKLVMGG